MVLSDFFPLPTLCPLSVLKVSWTPSSDEQISWIIRTYPYCPCFTLRTYCRKASSMRIESQVIPFHTSVLPRLTLSVLFHVCLPHNWFPCWFFLFMFLYDLFLIFLILGHKHTSSVVGTYMSLKFIKIRKVYWQCDQTWLLKSLTFKTNVMKNQKIS